MSRVPKFKRKTISYAKRKKLEHHVFNVMSRKDKGRAKYPYTTNSYGEIIKTR